MSEERKDHPLEPEEAQARREEAPKDVPAAEESKAASAVPAEDAGRAGDTVQAEEPAAASGAVPPADAPQGAAGDAQQKPAEETKAPAAEAAAGKTKAAAVEAKASAAEGKALAADAKAKAAEARAARAAARAKKEEQEAAAPKEPSPNQPRLDRIVELIRQHVAEDAVQEAWLNDKDHDLPVLVIQPEHWPACARLMKEHEELKLNYLRNVSGVDYETYMEVVYHMISLETKHEYCVKVRTDREHPSVPSVTPVWCTANWPEREIYDLFGIDFPGHPDLRRILLPDDWVGHPLRKDYEPIDPEV